MAWVEEIQTRPERQHIAPLIVAASGTAGVISAYFLVPGLRLLESVLLLLVIAAATVGCRQNIIRGVMTALILHIASGVAATFHRMIAPYLSLTWAFLQLMVGRRPSPALSEHLDYDAIAFSFVLLTFIAGVALEALSRISFEDTSLPALGILDVLGGALIYLVVGILVATLLFNAIGYSTAGRRAHDGALLRSRFDQVLHVCYTAQSFWFPRNPPPIYVYDLDQWRER